MAGCCEQNGLAGCGEEPQSGARKISQNQDHSHVSRQRRGNRGVKEGISSDNAERQRCRFRGNLRWTRPQSITKLGAIVWTNELSLAIAPVFSSRRCYTFTDS